MCAIFGRTKRILIFDLLNFLSLVGIITGMMQAYIQRFDVYVFFVRVANFFFTKIVFDMLVGLYLIFI